MLFHLLDAARAPVVQGLAERFFGDAASSRRVLSRLNCVVKYETLHAHICRASEPFQNGAHVGLEQRFVLVSAYLAKIIQKLAAHFAPAVILQGGKDELTDFLDFERAVISALRDRFPRSSHGQASMRAVAHGFPVSGY